MHKYKLTKIWTTLGLATILIAPTVLTQSNVQIHASRYHHSRITRQYKRRYRHIRHHNKRNKHYRKSMKRASHKRISHREHRKQHKYRYRHHKRLHKVIKYRHKYKHHKRHVINQLNKRYKRHIQRSHKRFYKHVSHKRHKDTRPQIMPKIHLDSNSSASNMNTTQEPASLVSLASKASNSISQASTASIPEPNPISSNNSTKSYKPTDTSDPNIPAPIPPQSEDDVPQSHQADGGTYYGNENAMEQQIKDRTVADINSDRESNGLQPLKTDTHLDHYAYNRAQELAIDYSHRGALRNIDGVPISENIADASLGEETQEGSPKLYDAHNGTDIADQCNDVMLNYDQPEGNGHRINILSPTATSVGVGVSQKDGTYYIAEDFEHINY